MDVSSTGGCKAPSAPESVRRIQLSDLSLGFQQKRIDSLGWRPSAHASFFFCPSKAHPHLHGPAHATHCKASPQGQTQRSNHLKLRMERPGSLQPSSDGLQPNRNGKTMKSTPNLQIPMSLAFRNMSMWPGSG